MLRSVIRYKHFSVLGRRTAFFLGTEIKENFVAYLLNCAVLRFLMR
jgi:hypothetical protein